MITYSTKYACKKQQYKKSFQISEELNEMLILEKNENSHEKIKVILINFSNNIIFYR